MRRFAFSEKKVQFIHKYFSYNLCQVWLKPTGFPRHAISLKVEYLIICIICDTDLVNKLILQVYTLHKYK